MAKYTAERDDSSEGSKKWGFVLGAIGVIVAVSPFVVGANGGRVFFAFLVAGAFFAAAFSVASDGDLDGPPPRRSG